ncbi:MAG TPA: transglutaminaseTgpA domain-containing protein [Acidimicrobiales bacterium]|nr:transglutaminaseTgpA domain-containing protein [Acidimicrobiales bacterium]
MEPVEKRTTPLLAEITLFFVSLVATEGSLRVVERPPGVMVLGVFGACVAGHVVTSASRRLRAPAPAPVAWGLVGVAITTTWILVPRSTWWGVPTVSTARALGTRLHQAAQVLGSRPTPLPADRGVVLVFVALAGAVAVAGRALYALAQTPKRRRSRYLLVLAPSFVLFFYTSLFSSDRGRLIATLSYLVVSLAFVAAAEAAFGTASSDRWAIFGRGMALGALSVFAALAATVVPAVANTNLRIFVHTYGSGGGSVSSNAGTQSIDGLALIDDLGAVETSQSDSIAFISTSPFPTFWQVGSLTSFDGVRWKPDAMTAAFATSRFPNARTPSVPVLAQPSSSLFSATVGLQQLHSWLLPAPPGTTLVEPDSSDGPLRSPVISPAVGVVLAANASTDSRLRYRVIAATPYTQDDLDALAASGTSTTVLYPPASTLEPYLSLPPVPSSVVQLAHRIVSRSANPAAEVLALENWFTSGSFRYTLDPPAPAGHDPLTTFLFDTKAGFCQQFAGAYAVLARIDGLPTRVAVGFTPGRPVGDDTYMVSAIDAHVWPQVYLGPSVGWLSVDPTPGDGSGVGSTPGPLPPPSKTGQNKRAHIGLGSSSSTIPGTPPTTAPPSLAPRSAQSGHGATSRGGELTVVIALVCASVVLFAFIFLVVFRRRRREAPVRPHTRVPAHDKRSRGRRSTLSTNDADLLRAWRKAAGSFERAGLGRWSSESPTEHAGRVRVCLGGHHNSAVDSYDVLARMASRAGYSDQTCTDSELEHGRALARNVSAELRSRRGRSQPPSEQPASSTTC